MVVGIQRRSRVWRGAALFSHRSHHSGASGCIASYQSFVAKRPSYSCHFWIYPQNAEGCLQQIYAVRSSIIQDHADCRVQSTEHRAPSIEHRASRIRAPSIKASSTEQQSTAPEHVTLLILRRAQSACRRRCLCQWFVWILLVHLPGPLLGECWGDTMVLSR